jgi:acyl carrier protein
MDNTIYVRVVEALVGTAGIAADALSPEVELQSLGLDSLAMLEVGLGLEKEFGVEIDDSEVAKAQTVADLVEVVQTARAQLTN